MDINQERIQLLFEKYYNKSASEFERMELAEIIEQADAKETIVQLIEDYWKNHEEESPVILPSRSNEIIVEILGKNNKAKPKGAKVLKINRWFKISAAACVLFLIGAGTWQFFMKDKNANLNVAHNSNNIQLENVQPGKQGAILTLANGKKIVLDDLKNGKVTDAAEKEGDRIVYTNIDPKKEIEYNSMSTPNGRQYRLVLEDGSKVWLNAASSITYPTSFPGNERVVSITGEAYFEVAHDDHKPFHVKVGDMDVQVLGTHFNINSYENEPRVNTSLLEGSISVSINSKVILLKPGQQLQVNIKNGETHLSNKIDPTAVLAWKNGFFAFNDADIKTIMRQVERWYDVEVDFEQNIPEVHFSGKIARNLNLRDFLNIMDDTRINYSIEGKVLTIKP